MQVTIYRHHNMTAALSTDHAASSHGLPVLVIDGKAYGPADALPIGSGTAEGLARRYIEGWVPVEGRWLNRSRGIALARRFLGQQSGEGRTGRPLKGDVPRVLRSYMMEPSTAAAIESDRRDGESQGQVLDRWAQERPTA